MMRFATALGMSLLTVSTVSAQQQPDLNDVLKAIQGLGQEVRGIKDDVEKLKNGPSSTSPATTGPTGQASSGVQTAPAAPKVQGQLRPGWIVNAYIKKQYQDGNFDSDPLVTFIWPNNLFNSKIHMKSHPATNVLSYRADAFFRAKESGRYVFSVKSENQYGSVTCIMKIYIDDQEVVKSDFMGWPPNFSVQSGINLSEGDYRIRFEHVCNDASESQTNFSVQVRSPSDMAPRVLAPNEIVHIARPNQRSSNDTAPASSPNTPQSGETRLVKSEVNVRRQATTSSGVAAVLQPGDRIRIASLTDDQQWAQVESNGQSLGFIRVSALNLNTH